MIDMMGMIGTGLSTGRDATRGRRRAALVARASGAAFVTIVLSAAPGQAQTTTLGGSDFTMVMSRIDAASGALDPLDDTARASFFSAARCACPTNLGVSVGLTSDGVAKLVSTDSLDATIMIGSDCDNLTATACATVGSNLTLNASATSSSETLTSGDIFAQLAPGASCTALPSTSSRLWAIIRLNGTRLTTHPSVTIGLGGQGPGAPTAVATTTADSGLLVSWTAPAAGGAVQGYQVFCSPGPTTPPAAAFDSCAAGLLPDGGTGPFASLDATLVCSDLVASGTTATRVHGLQNGNVYQIAVVAIGSDGTPSAPSNVATGTPGPTLGFQDIYKNDGGTGLTGCALGGRSGARDSGGPGGGATAALVAGAIALLLLRRRRARALFLLPLSVGWLVARTGAAHAANGYTAPPTPALTLDGEPSPPPPNESPRNWNLEIRLGPYYPAVDSEFADRGESARPFQQVFSSSKRVMAGAEIDRQISHRWGTWAIGVAAANYRATASSLAADQVTRTGDETSLRIIPLSLLGIYRADLLRERFNSPLIPYAKLGLDCALWSASDSSKSGSTSGKTLGWNAAAGVSLDLSLLDPDAARTMDLETGVNQFALFFEVSHSALDGFGSSSVLHLGDNTWVAGLMLEM